MHQDGVDRDAVKPRRKGRVASKRRELAEHLKKCVLSEIFCLSGVVRHA
jgi:hypothetical protein